MNLLGAILESVLGGVAGLFSVVEVEDRIFKFTVLDRHVGLLVYGLKSHACASFKLFFHLCNESGLSRANAIPVRHIPGRSSLPSPSSGTAAPPLGRLHCVRCLSNTHSRSACRNRVHCSSCLRLGHVAIYCRFPPRFLGLAKGSIFSSQICPAAWGNLDVNSWFRQPKPMTAGLESDGPQAFVSLGHFSQVHLGNEVAGISSSIPGQVRTIPFLVLAPRPTSSPRMSEPLACDPLLLDLVLGQLPPATASGVNHPPPRSPNPQASHQKTPPARRNPDLAIITIDPLPLHQVSFNGIRNVLTEFLRDHMRIGFSSIQPCPFGQAYVRFNFYHDRDQLIQNSPHDYGDVRISFVEHDKGSDHRAVKLNYEVWLMLLGFSVDYWSEQHEEDPNHIARVLIKARVVTLEEIPWFVVGTDGLAFDGDSWTIQTEIIQTRMLGAFAVDEDQPPGPDDIQPQIFDFFGFGQPGQGHANQSPNHQNDVQNVDGPNHTKKLN
uniref:DUF7597 domain-containing protein n=1 Tax=Setaria viridis TaxID=4556 RepID=A0A4U6UAQ4_SETVI|nr:hypothetical protein SEVIR_5G023600v2 [Setaria viridis]